MVDEEIYLGGITSSDIMVLGYPGNGIHVTNKRLILVRTRAVMGASLFGMMGGGLLGSERSGRLTGPGAKHRLGQLEKRKYFEVLKEDTVSLEIKAPGRDRWSKLRIVPKSGEPVDVGLTAVRDYEYTKDLMASFCPEVLKII